MNGRGAGLGRERQEKKEGEGRLVGLLISFNKVLLLARRWRSSTRGPMSSVERGNLVKRSQDPPVRRVRQRAVPETSFSEGVGEVVMRF